MNVEPRADLIDEIPPTDLIASRIARLLTELDLLRQLRKVALNRDKEHAALRRQSGQQVMQGGAQ